MIGSRIPCLEKERHGALVRLGWGQMWAVRHYRTVQTLSCRERLVVVTASRPVHSAPFLIGAEFFGAA